MATSRVERNAATLLWRIENLNYYDPKIHNTEICSPFMTIRTLEVEHCSLLLKLDKKDTRLTLYIENELDFSIDCDFSILADDQSVLISRKIRNREIKAPTHIRMPNFPKYEEIFQAKKFKFLPDNTLCVRCQIWKSSENVPVSETIVSSSQIRISEDCILLAIEKLHTLTKTAHIAFSNASHELEDFEIIYYLMGDSLCSFNFGFDLYSDFIPETLLMRMKVSMLGDRQETITVFDAKHAFMESNSLQYWIVKQCSFSKMLQNKMAKFSCNENLNLLIHFTAVHQRLQESQRSYIGTSCIKYNNTSMLSRPTFVEFKTSPQSDITTNNARIISCPTPSEMCWQALQQKRDTTFNTRIISSPTPSEMCCQALQQNGDTTCNARIISSPKFIEASCQTSQPSEDTTHSVSIISCSKFKEASCQTSLQCCDALHSLQGVSDSMDVLIEDFHTMYCEQTFSDFELCSGDVTFHVHKNILSARSPVFKAMFSSNMKESSSQSLDIPDLDSHTLNRLLSFLYSGSIEADLDHKSAAKLYYAADKYEVNSLKCQCSSILQSATAVSNVCDILILADKHQDKELMTSVENFILNRFNEVMRSEEWGKLLEIDAYLAASTVRKICIRM